MFAELPLSTNTLLVVKSAIGKAMTIASSYGWWILLASSSMNVMACSFVVLVLGDRLESWMFCTTFRYIFLDLEDCHVEVPPMMTLIFLSGGLDGSSNFSFNLSSLWSRPRKFLNFPYLMRFSICYFRSLIRIMPMVSVEVAIFIPIAFVGISLHFFEPLQGRIILDLHKHLFQWHVQRCILLTSCWRAYLFIVSVFFFSCSPLLWTRTLFRVVREIWFHSFCSLPLLGYNRVFCIHKILGWMDELGHGLRLFLVKLIDKSEFTPLWKAVNNNLSSISFTVKVSLLKRVMKDRMLSFSLCSMVNRLDEERLCLCPPMKLLTNNLLNSSKELTMLGWILLNHTRTGPWRW